MSVLPGEVNLGTAVRFGSYPTHTWKVEKGRLSGFTDGLDAMRQAVDVALHVRRFHWQIYTPNVGHELDILGQDYDTARVRLQAQVKAALSADDRITGVDGFRFSRDGGAMTCSCTVHTIFGDLETEVTL